MLVTLNKNTWKCQNFFKAICGAFEVVKQDGRRTPKTSIGGRGKCTGQYACYPVYNFFKNPRIQFFIFTLSPIIFQKPSPHILKPLYYTPTPQGREQKNIFIGRGYKIKNPPLRRDVLSKSGLVVYIVKVFVVSIVLLFLSQFFARNYFFIL